MTIHRTEDGWQLKCFEARRDFHVRHEPETADAGMSWALDEFDLRVENNQDAHIESTAHETMAGAFHEAFDRSLDAMRQPQ